MKYNHQGADGWQILGDKHEEWTLLISLVWSKFSVHKFFSCTSFFNWETIIQISIESQSHRKVECKENSKSFGPTSGQLQQVAQDCVYLSFEYLRGWRLHEQLKQYLYSAIFSILRGISRGNSKTLTRNYHPHRPLAVPLTRLLIDLGSSIYEIQQVNPGSNYSGPEFGTLKIERYTL